MALSVGYMEGVRMAVMEVTEDWSLGMENILAEMTKLVRRRTSIMMIQAHTGRINKMVALTDAGLNCVITSSVDKTIKVVI